MRTRRLAKNGPEVSAVGMGCMGLSHAFGPPTPYDEAVKVIRAAYEAGYTFFDTAQVYTGINPDGTTSYNEEMVGEALRDVRDDVVIATKFGVAFTDAGLATDGTRDNMRRSVEGSLRRLGIERIDLYYQHRQDPDVPVEEVAGAMQELIDEGKIAAWGMSEVDVDTIRRADAVCPVTAVQNRYSMLARGYESIFPTLEELDITLVAFTPFSKGFLTGTMAKGVKFDPDLDNRVRNPVFTDQSFDENAPLLRLVADLAEAKGATMGQIALAWMLCKKPWIVPIPGSRNINRLRENAHASEVDLTTDEVRTLDEVIDALPKLPSSALPVAQGSGSQGVNR